MSRLDPVVGCSLIVLLLDDLYSLLLTDKKKDKRKTGTKRKKEKKEEKIKKEIKPPLP